jgi:hypothetical protein
MPMFTSTSMLIWAPLSTPILRLRPSVPLLSTSSASRHWPIMVETSARLHFTHQTETPPFVYIYILRTFSWLFQQNWHCSEPPDHSTSYSTQTFFQVYSLSTTSQFRTFREHFCYHYNSASKHSSVSPSPHPNMCLQDSNAVISLYFLSLYLRQWSICVYKTPTQC